MELFEKVNDFVKESFTKSGIKPEMNIKHLERTVYWMQQLKPDADEGMLIAAVSHDIERAYRKKSDKINQVAWASPEFYQLHQVGGADIVADFLRQQGADKQLISKVHGLISVHEVGGNPDANILQDADSISFLENNIQFFIQEQVPIYGKEEVKKKFNNMFERMNLEKSKEITSGWYKDAIKQLY